MLQIGQGILGKAQFKDGCTPQYPRTYLVVAVEADKFAVLNVSSTAGKEHKLLFPTNRPIQNYNPPFLKDSFVKLDSLQYFPLSDSAKFSILHKGDRLDTAELSDIINNIAM